MKKEIKRKLPGGWNEKELKSLGKIVTGNTPPRAEVQFYGGHIPWIKPEDLDQDLYVSKSLEYLSDEGVKVARLLPKGAILVSCIGNIGKMAIAGTDLATNQQINSLVIENDYDNKFVYFAVKNAMQKLVGKVNQSLVPIINATTFGKLEIPVPTAKSEQVSISNKLERKVNEFEKMRQSALKQKDAISAMQGAILRGVFPYKEGDKLPTGWKWEKIGNHILDRQSGLACGDKSRNEGYAHLRMNNISRDFKLDLTSLWRIPASNKEVENYRVKEGDILFNNTNSAELVGKSCLFDSESKDVFLFSNHLTRIRTKETLYPLYLLYWVNILWNGRYFENNCDIWVNQAAIRAEDSLFPLNIPMPPRIDDQIRIVAKLKQKFNELEKMSDVVGKKLEAIEAMQGAILRETFDFQEVNN